MIRPILHFSEKKTFHNFHFEDHQIRKIIILEIDSKLLFTRVEKENPRFGSILSIGNKLGHDLCLNYRRILMLRKFRAAMLGILHKSFTSSLSESFQIYRYKTQFEEVQANFKD